MDFLTFIFTEIEDFLTHKIKPLYQQPGGLKDHYLLLFTTDKVSVITVKQEQYAHVMMHAVSQLLAQRVPVLEAVAIVADGITQVPDNVKVCKVIVYFKKASYSRTYNVDVDSKYKMILKETQEAWYKPEEQVAGFNNPFNSTELASKVPKVDVETIYNQVSKQFSKDRKRQSKQLRQASQDEEKQSDDENED